MAITYGRKKHRQTNIIHTVVTVLLLCTVFLMMVSVFYKNAEDDAYETLHLQTKQIKDDITLQLISDRENLATMASFAAKLYARGEDYSIMFDSFNPIGLFSRIGILTPDSIFIEKDRTTDLKGRISFEKEVELGKHVTGRTYSYSRPDEEVVRSAVPIIVNGKTVGMIYGIIKIETINEKYNKMANELDAQLFVYDKATGKYIIDTINSTPGELSELKNREYNDGYTYEELATEDKGFSSFKSIRTGENLYLHYSIIEEFNWGIMLARYETQVFAKTHIISRVLFTAFLIMIVIMILYTLILIKSEKRRNHAMVCASNIRKLLLEINQQHNNIREAMKQVCLFSKARSAIFFDTDGEDYNYSMPEIENKVLKGEDRKYFIGELLHYAAELYKINKLTIGVMCINPNEHLTKTNPDFYNFLKKHDIEEISYAAVTDKDNHVTVLGTINTQKGKLSRILLYDIVVCFSIAIYNKKHLNRTEIAATTDSLTGVSNRVSYKKDILMFDEVKSEKFSCIYIDVNELHLINNKYGHAAGDEMLLFIANTLKEVFFGNYIYRMGGDEFLVFVQDEESEDVKRKIESLIEQLKPKDYHVAIGMSHRSQNTNTEEMVREAEVRMYEAKAQYYQNKEQYSTAKTEDTGYVQMKTGIREIDAMLSVLKEHYFGIYRVSLDTDEAHRILMPAYLSYNEDEEHYSELLEKYIEEMVAPDFRRAIMSFLNYDALKRQLIDGKIPKITYKKTNGEPVMLSVYKLNDGKENASDTLWFFSKK